MDITTTTQAYATVIRIAGSMDATTVADFDAEWKKQLEAGAGKLVVEMSGLDYISSAGLRGILSMGKACKAAKAALAFCSMQAMACPKRPQ